MNNLHTALADGSKIEKNAIESDSVSGYYSYLMANNARCEKIRAEMEKMKGNK